MAKNTPFFIEYKKNLLSLFQFFTSEPKFRDNFIQNSIGYFHNVQRLLSSSNKNSIVKIELPIFEIPLANGIECGAKNNAFISFGGPIEIDNTGRIEQSISVCLILEPLEKITKCASFCRPEMEPNSKHIIRRFHFDFDTTLSKADRPLSHIQYGGNLHDNQKNDFDYRLISTVDLPRIPSIPLDAVQVINFFLHQFDTDVSHLFQQPKWRGIVVNNDEIWKKFYMEAMINSLNKRNTFYELLCVSKPC